MEADDVKQHFLKILKLHEELAATRKVIDEVDFASIITNSLPPSYKNVISLAYSAIIVIGRKLSTDQIINAAQEEYSC